MTNPHGCVEGSGNLVVLLQTWTASQNFWQPELAHGTLHVGHFALSWRWCFHPLRRFPADTTYHVGMGERLWRSLSRLDVEGRWDGLSDSRVKGRGPARNDEGMINILIPRGRPVPSDRPNEGRVEVSQRRPHDESMETLKVLIFNC